MLIENQIDDATQRPAVLHRFVSEDALDKSPTRN
jgi:hypothetical protein